MHLAAPPLVHDDEPLEQETRNPHESTFLRTYQVVPTAGLPFARQFLTALRKNWRRAIIVFLLILGSAVGATALWPRKYQSEARLYVNVGRETVHLDPTATTGQTVQFNESREREIASLLELLRSRTLFETVVDQIGVSNILNERPCYAYGGMSDWSFLWEAVTPQRAAENGSQETMVSSQATGDPKAAAREARRREHAVAALMGSIRCTVPRNSSIITITADAKSPECAQKKLACLLDTYQEQHLRVNRISGSFTFFDAQVKAKSKLLETKVAEVRDAKNAIGVSSIDAQRDLYGKESALITDSILQAQTELSSAVARAEKLQATLPAEATLMDLKDASGSTTDAVNLMRAKLFELQIEEQKVLSQCMPDHPLARLIVAQVNKAKQLLKRQELLVERSLIVKLTTKVAEAQKQRAEVDRKLKSLNSSEVHIVELERQRALLEAAYNRAFEQRTQASTDEELQRKRISNINVAQAPSFIASPTTPAPSINLMLGLAAATFGAVVVSMSGSGAFKAFVGAPLPPPAPYGALVHNGERRERPSFGPSNGHDAN